MKPHESYGKKTYEFWTKSHILDMLPTQKTADCQPLPFPTSFKLTAPANVFEATRILPEKTDFDFKEILHHWHQQNFKVIGLPQ